MRKVAMVLFPLIVALLCAVPMNSYAHWAEDGAVISNDANSQSNPLMVPDGMGGAIVVWVDHRLGNGDIYAQRFNVSGTPLWTANGVPVCTEPSYQDLSYVQLCADGYGGVIVTWGDSRYGNSDIFAQRIGPDGTARWTANGVPICTEATNQRYPQAVPDGAGGAIIVWEDWRNGDLDVYAQRIDAGGTVWWTYNGINLCNESGNQTWIRAASDGNGGMISAWMDVRNGNYDVYSQRVNGSGNAQWTTNGVPIATLTSTDGNPCIIADGAGGAFITWMDQRSGPSDIYAQRINSSGAVQWAVNGVAVAVAANTQFYSFQDLDGAGGMVVSWGDERNSGTYDIYAQRMDGSGVAQWTTNGVLLESRPFYQYDPRIVSDGTGGAIVTWTDNNNIFAQRVDGAGTVQWQMEGLLVCGAADGQDKCRIISNDDGGAYIVWHDYRAGNHDIYASNIEPDGSIFDVPPSISSAVDVPADQGGNVYLAWDACRDELCRGDWVTHYTIWRAIDPAAALLSAGSGRPMLEAGSGLAADLPLGSVRVEILDGAPWYWELVASQDLYYQDTYGLPLSTLCDSVGTETGWHYFQVVAQTADPMVFWTSEPDSGYSVDNLAPGAPLGLAGEQSFAPEGLGLSWDPNSESDLFGYRIYRDTDPSFEPGPGNFVVSTPDTFSFDGDWTWESGYAYKVTAVDIHGNESLWALLMPSEVTGDDPMPLPDATFLKQNFPNPFNPVTTIGFGLKESGYVSLRIYDAAGRLVTTLVDESRPAGSYSTEWNGQSSDGAPVSSGVYFYRLRTGEFVETRKMILLR